MKELSRSKKQEVAQYYLLGSSYGDIEIKTGVSHGSIANIIQELENGKLTIPGTQFDQVNDLHQLSLDLKKKGLDPSPSPSWNFFLRKTQAIRGKSDGP